MVNESTRLFLEFSEFHAKYRIPIRLPSKALAINQYSACVVMMILIIPTVALNAVSLITIMRCSQLKRKISYFLIMMQSVADLAVGFITLPTLCYVAISETQVSASCRTNIFLVRIVSLFTLFSLLTLTAINIERCIGVIHPIRHRTLVTKKRILFSLTLGIFFVLVGLALSFLGKRILSVFNSTFFFIFLVTSVYVYSKIVLKMRKREHLGSAAESSTSNRRSKIGLLQELKLAKSCCLVVSCFILSFFIAAFFHVLNRNERESMMIRSWAMFAIFMNSSINSLIFFWSRPLLRAESYKIVKGMFTSKGLRSRLGDRH